MRRLRESYWNWWSQRSESTRALPRFYLDSNTQFHTDRHSSSGGIGLLCGFLYFPLILLFAIGIGNLLEPAVAQEQIANGLKLFLPEATISDIQLTLDQALQQSSSFGILAVAGVIWSALGLFSNLTASLDTIFDVPSGRSMWRQRLLAFTMSITLVVLVFASFLTSGVLRLVSIALLDPPSIVTLGTVFLPLGLDVVIFALLFRYVPSRYVHWDAIWPAAMVGAVGWELAKSGFQWYLDNLQNYQLIYGGIATAIVLLFWAFLLAGILILSAELCARLNEWFLQQEQDEAQERNRLQISLENGKIRVQMPETNRAYYDSTPYIQG